MMKFLLVKIIELKIHNFIKFYFILLIISLFIGCLTPLSEVMSTWVGRDVDEVVDIQIFRDAITGPGSAPHAQCKVKPVIKASTIAESVSLVDQDSNNI